MDENQIEECDLFSLHQIPVIIKLDKKKSELIWESIDKRDIGSLVVQYILASEVKGNNWVVHYAKKSSDLLVDAKVIFECDKPDIANIWKHNIQEILANPRRPKNLLIFINPNSGRWKSVQNYYNIVAPLFSKAGIKTDVIITEDVDHAGRVISKYDLTSVDGLVSCGGDGTFIHVLGSLLQRTMTDSGHNADDHEEQLIPNPIPVGIIPCGTGQAMTRICYKMESADITTAALVIVLGNQTQGNVMSIHQNHQLKSYAAMQVMYGVFSDTIVTAEHLRWMGIFRYIYAISKHMLTRPRQFAATWNLLIETDDGEKWVTHSDIFIMLHMQLFSFLEGNKHLSLAKYWEEGDIHAVSIDGSAGMWGNLRFSKRFLMFDAKVDDFDFIKNYDVKAIKFNLPKGSPQFNYLNIDGEAIPFTEGEIFVKLHKKAARVYGRELDPNI